MPSVKASCFATSVLPTPVGPENRNEPIGLSAFAEPRARHLDRCGQRFDRGILTEHDVLQIAIEVLKLRAIVARHRLRRDASNFRDDLFDLGLADRFLLLRLRQDALRSARFVDHVNRLVGQMTIVNELG